MKTRIVLADDHRIVLEGLRALIENEPDMEVVGEAGDGHTAMRLVRELKPDVVVLDIVMPNLNGIDAARQIRAEAPDTKIIALSMHSDRRFVSQMLQAGAVGYLVKGSAFDELCRAVRVVASGQTYLGPGIADVVVRDYLHGRTPGADTAGVPLSGREREVLQLLAEGNSTKAIAERLFVSIKTVETHRRNMMEKLGVDNVAALIKYAIREGLTSTES